MKKIFSTILTLALASTLISWNDPGWKKHREMKKEAEKQDWRKKPDTGFCFIGTVTE